MAASCPGVRPGTCPRSSWHGTATRLSELKKLRLTLAKERKVAAYIIFPDSTLIEMAPRLLHRLDPEGRLILAGILNREADRVIDAYHPAMRCIDRRADRGWTALVLAR